METFADYILNEKNPGSKMEITYYLAKKKNIFFEKISNIQNRNNETISKYSKLRSRQQFINNSIITSKLQKNGSSK